MIKKKKMRNKIEYLKKIGIEVTDDLIKLISILDDNTTFPEGYDTSIETWDESYLRERIAYILDNIGGRAEATGYIYLIDAIIIVIKDKNTLSNLSEYVYKKISNKYNVSWRGVGSAINREIGLIYSYKNRKKISEFSNIFFSEVKENNYKPTNRAFIRTVINYIVMSEK